MNDFIKYIFKFSVCFALIIAVLLACFGIALLLFPQVVLLTLRYVLAAACLAGGIWFAGSIAVSLIRAKAGAVSGINT